MKGDFRPRTKPGVFRGLHEYVLVTDVGCVRREGRTLSVADWYVFGVAPLTKTPPEGPGKGYLTAGFEMPLYRFTAIYRRVRPSNVPTGWVDFLLRCCKEDASLCNLAKVEQHPKVAEAQEELTRLVRG